MKSNITCITGKGDFQIYGFDLLSEEIFLIQHYNNRGIWNFITEFLKREVAVITNIQRKKRGAAEENDD